MHSSLVPARRRLIVSALAAGAAAAVPAAARAQAASAVNDLLAPNPAEFNKAMTQFVGTAKPSIEGLLLDVPLLADNPSAVPVTVKVTLPITDDDWCEEIVVLAEKNPSPVACRMQFTAAAGTAEASVRVRLSQSQTVHALARMKSGKVLAAEQPVTVAVSGCGM